MTKHEGDGETERTWVVSSSPISPYLRSRSSAPRKQAVVREEESEGEGWIQAHPSKSCILSDGTKNREGIQSKDDLHPFTTRERDGIKRQQQVTDQSFLRMGEDALLLCLVGSTDLRVLPTATELLGPPPSFDADRPGVHGGRAFRRTLIDRRNGDRPPGCISGSELGAPLGFDTGTGSTGFGPYSVYPTREPAGFYGFWYGQF
ncbi:hypothetical protein B0H14DRAFT_2616393 [Mycena olivaceomarginata]|nr:hypothetical protein B0H14DRAFT_2616393 [Mycena olivaceomarginata]